jgi:hypothetical protein
LKNCAWLIKNSKTNLSERFLKPENYEGLVDDDSSLECDFEQLKKKLKRKKQNLKKLK